MYCLLTKKDIIGFNQESGESGKFNNESSLDFALSIVKIKKNWIYELSYLIRSLLVDHVFEDGNKGTSLLIIIYYLENNKREIEKTEMLRIIKKIAKNNITNPTLIARFIYNATTKENQTTSRRE